MARGGFVLTGEFVGREDVTRKDGSTVESVRRVVLRDGPEGPDAAYIKASYFTKEYGTDRPSSLAESVESMSYGDHVALRVQVAAENGYLRVTAREVLRHVSAEGEARLRAVGGEG